MKYSLKNLPRKPKHPIFKFIIFTLLLISCSFTLEAQRTINGTVIDGSTNEPLIGANIVVVDTLIGTVTDIDGNFTLAIPIGYNTIRISYTGFQMQEVDISGTSQFEVSLSPGELLEEVVVIGYGTIKREDATGSVQSITSEDFNRGAITGASELLAGKVPGVTITTGGGPGEGSAIRIRGESSLSATNDPLIVIDGVPIDNSGVSGARNVLNIINPNDIETFTVLKDASAAAIYGNRAAGGVILITTKKGTVGSKLKIGYNGNVSIGKATNFVDVLTADEYRSIVAQQYEPDHPIYGKLGDASTNWQEAIYESAFGQDHNIYGSGAIGEIPYRVSLGYTNKDGILMTDNFQRFTAGVNINPRLFDNTLQMNISLKTMQTDNNFADRGAIGNAIGFDPTQSIRNPSSSAYGGFTTWVDNNGNPELIAPTNPLALLELREDMSDVSRTIFNVSADYRIPFFTDLRANLNLAIDKSKGEGSVVVPNTASFAFDELNGGGVNNVYEQSKDNDLLEFYLNYKKGFGKSDVDLMAGYSWQHFAIDNSFTNSDAAGTPSETTTGSDPAEYFLVSMFGRANLTYDDKYLLTFTLRRDGTSRFSPDNRWGLFPAAALAVKLIDNESTRFNSLKLRAGWGITGQQDIGDFYAYLARYQFGNENAQYQFGNEYITTIRPNGYDENIRWEETSTINLGLDFSIIPDRLSGSLDVYQRKTKDLLNRVPVPAGTNLTNFVTTNVGDLENQGIELALYTTPIVNENVKIDFGVNVAYNENEITRLIATDDPEYIGVLTGGIAGGVGSNIQIHSVGFAPRSFYVFKQLYDENGMILEDQFEDLNGDGVVDEDDKYRYEKPAPDYTFGFTSKIDVHNFSLSFAGRASLGNFVYNNIQTDQGYLNRIYHSSGTLWNVHQSAVDNQALEQASLTFSDHFVRPADFLRMDHITLGYTFDNLIGDFARLYATVQNPFVITQYDGLDPEIFGGIDNNIYPRPTTYVFGINVEF
jgi:iron complex outermembrane receptor protein